MRYGIHDRINMNNRKYKWPNVKKTVENFIKNCETSNKTKTEKN